MKAKVVVTSLAILCCLSHATAQANDPSEQKRADVELEQRPHELRRGQVQFAQHIGKAKTVNEPEEEGHDHAAHREDGPVATAKAGVAHGLLPVLTTNSLPEAAPAAV